MNNNTATSTTAPWYRGVTGYQWLVLIIASAGWIFDVYEGQIFNITRNQLLADILKVGSADPAIKHYGDMFLGIFLLGGTAGGLLFGLLADRFGRKPTLAATILMYSVFSGLTYFATELWHVAVLRFLVAMGVGGEWAVAASLVAEVFPVKARAHAGGIFHATSILGTWLAALAGILVGSQWRYAYLIGVAPAILILWVRVSIKEPDSWKQAGQRAQSGGDQMGRLRDLFTDARWAKRAVLGMLMAAVGLGTFWGVTVAGQDLAKEHFIRSGRPEKEAVELAKTAYGFIQAAGGGIGLLAFGPLCVRLGRKRAFTVMQLAALVIVPIMCYAPRTDWQLFLLLPIFGGLTLGIHAGYAIYFPELFPTRLRATGTSFCFNVGRAVAASVLFFSGWLKAQPGMDLRMAVTLLGLLFLAGVIVIQFLPETKDQPLPE